MSADETFEFLNYVISVYDMTMDSVVTIIGGNENTNHAVVCRVGPTFVGYHSHRFHLAARNVINEFNDVTVKEYTIMRKLSFQIPAAKFHQLTLLRPKLSNRTRWSFVYEMVKRCLFNRPFIIKIELEKVQALLLTSDDDAEISRLMGSLEKLKSVTKAL